MSSSDCFTHAYSSRVNAKTRDFPLLLRESYLGMDVPSNAKILLAVVKALLSSRIPSLLCYLQNSIPL